MSHIDVSYSDIYNQVKILHSGWDKIIEWDFSCEGIFTWWLKSEFQTSVTKWNSQLCQGNEIRGFSDLLSIGQLGTNFNGIWFKIQTFSVKKMRFKILSGKCRPFCSGLTVLNVLIRCEWIQPRRTDHSSGWIPGYSHISLESSTPVWSSGSK